MIAPLETTCVVVVLFAASLAGSTAFAKDASTESLPDLSIVVVDEAGEPVRGVQVGTKRSEWEHGDGVLKQLVPGSLVKWAGNGERAVPLITDADERVRFLGEDVFKWRQKQTIYALDPAGGRVAMVRVTRDDLTDTLTVRLELACLITADFTCKALDDRGIPLFETVSYLSWEDIPLVLTHHSNEKRCAFIVPPGKYSLRLFGFGRGIPVPDSGGAPTQELGKTVTVVPGQRRLDLGTLDFEPTEQALMFGHPAPELENIALWKNTEPLRLADLRGKVVLLAFWSRHCGGTPDMVAWLDSVRDRLADRGLEIIAIHEADPELSDLAAFDTLAQPAMDEYAAEFNEIGAIDLPIAVAGGEGLGDVYRAYHISRCPTGFLIDRNGNVAHVFQHSVDETAIERALDQAD